MIIILLLVLLALAFQVAQWRRLRPYASRSCSGREWHRSFPAAPKATIRAFLKLVVGDFGLPRRLTLKLRPNDRLLDLNRAIYPPSFPVGDQLEFEEFALSLEQRHGVLLDPIWRDDITLGEIFSRTLPRLST